MRINSNPEVSGGQPHLPGHRLSVGAAVSHIQEKGLADFIKTYGLGNNLDRELIGIRLALDYCRNQSCANEASAYCTKCSRGGNPSARTDLSAVASELFRKYFVKEIKDSKV